MNCFASILVHHPYIILLAVAVFSGTCLVIPFTLKALPNFSDPQMGFETRGTSIANRVTTWKNLVEATKESGTLVVNPKELMYRRNITKTFKPHRKKNNRKKNWSTGKPKLYVNTSTKTKINVAERNWRDLKSLFNLTSSGMTSEMFYRHYANEGFFCGPPSESYSHVILKSINDTDLFTVESLLAMCRIERELIQAKHYKDLCVMTTKRPKKRQTCCRPWSLANYVALLQNRTSCLAINEVDVNTTKALLRNCSRYYHNIQLTPDCTSEMECSVPHECIVHTAVFNIFNFLTSTSFLPPNNTSDMVLKETAIFLPVACSTATLPYFHVLENIDLDYGGISVVGMEFGIKTALFDELLIRDTWLMSFGGLFVLLCMWLYTASLFLTIMTIIAIVFSLGISYFMYTLVFELRFFPFMNLLAVIVAIGIGADDAFIFCKIWHTMKIEKGSVVSEVMNDTIHHALVSMIVTSVTTSAAFFASYISSITAIRCFSVFASMSVLANCLLMVLWFPACIVVWEQLPSTNCDVFKNCITASMQRWCCTPHLSSSMACHLKCSDIEKIWNEKENMIIEAVIKFRLFWFILLSILAFASAIIVFYYPKLQLPNSTEFQLFDSSHIFEQYDLTYKNLFWFTKSQRAERESDINYKLPLRFVWGVLPQDNGNYLEPHSLGTLKMDPNFNMSDPKAQEWLLSFCKQLRRQPFYQSTLGPMLPNCFIENFISWMHRRCVDGIDYKDRSPCCEKETFPFKHSVFETCIIEAIGYLYETPVKLFIPGVAGPKFSKDQNPTIKAIVVEYDSNYSYSMSYEYMYNFISQVDGWFKEELKKAPISMQGGWFISDLQFYDLQRVLSEDTLIAIVLSMCLALTVVILATLNVITSLFAIFNITCSILVTMAILVLLGWKLNILESVAVSTAIGLTIDFSLHYTVSYKLAPRPILEDRRAATKHALSNMFKPVTMAALTTGMAGVFMMPSLILAYVHIGTFLITVMFVSWLYATFHLGSLLAMGGPQNSFGQWTYSRLICCILHRPNGPNNLNRNRPANSSNSDTHELDVLTNSKSSSQPVAPKPLERGDSLSKPSTSKYMFSDQSPSATSAITIIMAEDI